MVPLFILFFFKIMLQSSAILPNPARSRPFNKELALERVIYALDGKVDREVARRLLDEVLEVGPEVGWSSVAGLEEVKRHLQVILLFSTW